MSANRISRVVRRKEFRNPISGHCWSENIPTNMFEVWGGTWAPTKHYTLKAAEAEKALRDEMDRKYPFTMPRSKREIRKCKRLKLLACN